MKEIVCAFFFLMGCSFKKERPFLKAENGSLELKINNLKDQIPLKNSSDSLKGETFYLPLDFSDEFIFTLLDPALSHTERQDVRVFAKYKGSRLELPVSLVKWDSFLGVGDKPSLALQFHVHGFRNLLPQNESKKIEISVQREAQREVLFSMLTPPKNIEIRSLTPKDLSEKPEGEDITYTEIKFDEEREVLFRAIEIKSEEEEPVEVEFLQRDIGLIQTKIYERRYQDLGCSAQVHEERLSQENQGDFEFIPLNEEALSFSQDRFHLKEAFPEKLKITLNPHVPVFVGLFASDQASLKLFDEGKMKDSMTQVEFPSTCREVCERERVVCDPIVFSGRENEFLKTAGRNCQPVCLKYKTVRDKEGFVIGRSLEALRFIVNEKNTLLSARYSKSSHQFLSQRQFSFFTHFDLDGIWPPK